MPVSLYCLLLLSRVTTGGDKQRTGAVSHIGRVLTLTRPPASSYNPYGGSIGDNISETATDYCLSNVYHLTFLCHGSLSKIYC